MVAINAMIREMVTQSIVPFMESRVMTWNDQVASRRRGISGRFMTLSRRWAGFSSSKNPAGGTDGTPSSSGSNFNSQMGFYPPEAPEAIMRQLADYGVMLRDWRLAHSTYDVMRSDFSHDKAWAYHGAANEMAAISALLFPSSQTKVKPENVDQWLDTAIHSYLKRCSLPQLAVRCLIVTSELLQAWRFDLTDYAAKHARRLLELSILGSIEQNMVSERIADYYMCGTPATRALRSPRGRQAGLWNTLAASSWAALEKLPQAKDRIDKANHSYTAAGNGDSELPFPSMHRLWDRLESLVDLQNISRGSDSGFRSSDTQGTDTFPEEHLDTFVSRPSTLETDFKPLASRTLDEVQIFDGSKPDIIVVQNDDGFE